MAGHQAAAGTLKVALPSRSARLTEQDYINLIEQGFESPEALLDARDKSLEAILVCRGAVDAVLAWQAESKPKQHLGKWQCIPFPDLKCLLVCGLMECSISACLWLEGLLYISVHISLGCSNAWQLNRLNAYVLLMSCYSQQVHSSTCIYQIAYCIATSLQLSGGLH